ncbi:MAG TPA: NAD(P)H-dependent oxidoreductase subunit E [Bacteroidota bacterium]|nr:NAD(P)H-dependent oxidoreductase subunit E [Bacteroidota bacterium]
MEQTQTVARDVKAIDAVIDKHRGQHGELLSILEEVQLLNDKKYLPEESLNQVALRTGVPLARVYSVATFYSFFNLKPQGEHTITVCRGTACHTKGSRSLLEDIGLMLGRGKETADGEGTYTTPDNEFTVTTVACFGQCALAPVVAIDGVIYSNMTTARLQRKLSAITKRRKRA